jgi:chemotaxis protein MotB
MLPKPLPLHELQPVRLTSTGMPRPLSPPHRGGAWKVAYADFVTALMALFIVLWLMGTTDRVKQSVSGYFRDPRGYTSRLGAGPANSGEGMKVNARNVSDVRHQLEQVLRQAPEWDRMSRNVQFSMTGEGLRIDLMENEKGMFFVSGESAPTQAGLDLLQLLGTEISKLPNRLVIEGHTDSRPYRDAALAGGYSNWELSADRANAARRLLLQAGVGRQQVVEVRGFADQRLLNAGNSEDPKNRRVSLVVKFGELGR